jgi:hypothetical protein
MVTSWKELPSKQTFDPDSDIFVRQSTIGQLQLCGGRVGYETHDGYLSALSEPLVFGTCLHYILGEDILSGNEQQDKLLQSMGDWIEEILVTDYDWSLDQVPNVHLFFSELGSAYRLWRTNVLPHLTGELLWAEEEMLLPLGDGREKAIVLRGTPDAIYSDQVVDWKTAGRGWKQEKADVSIQASLYMALAKQKLNKSIRNATFWVFNRQSGKWERHQTDRTIPQIDAALRTAHQYGLQLEAEVFPCTPVPESSFNKKRGWYCSPKFCGAWNVCEAKYMNDGVNENVVAERKWQ